MDKSLRIIEEKVRKNKYSHTWSLYRCYCGNEKILNDAQVRFGNIRSCGCLKKQINSKTAYNMGVKNKKHGMSYSTEYHAWQGMHQRCYNVRDKRYKDWGMRGIRVCPEWSSFEVFFADMGLRPKGKTLDRLDNDGNYCKSNCAWRSPKEQANNRRKRKNDVCL